MNRPLKIVYAHQQLYLADGAVRVLTMKANYFAEHLDMMLLSLLQKDKGKNRSIRYQTRFM